MPGIINLAGQRFGRLTVLSLAPKHNGRTAWNCKCDCGRELVVIAKSLRSGNTKSCGCLNRELSSARYKTMTKMHGCTDTPLFRRWSGMIARCTQPSMPNYSLYGGRGISVCDEWKLFENFKAWAESSGFTESLTLDRIDPNGNYEPNNCRWATSAEQAENRRCVKKYTVDGESHCLAYWAKLVGLSNGALRNMVRKHPENAQAIVEEYVHRGCGRQEFARRKL